MSKIEEVKKILNHYWPEEFCGGADTDIAEEIAQIFEPKPDSPRLLPPDKIHDIQDKAGIDKYSGIRLGGEWIAEAQDAKSYKIGYGDGYKEGQNDKHN